MNKSEFGTSSANNLVIVTQRVDIISDRDERRDALDQSMIEWLTQAGYIAVVIPNVLIEASGGAATKKIDSWLKAINPSALLLSGGNDVGECIERDNTECYLLAWAKAGNIPVLGICRGLQMLAVFSGTDIVKVAGHVKTRHVLSIVNDESNWPVDVNSYHDSGLSVCPPGYDIVATSEDNSIEAIRNKQLPWEGWMWHPEREYPYSKADTARLKILFGGYL